MNETSGSKVFANIMKVITTIAAIIGVIYVVAVYGDRIVSWAKDLLDRLFDKRTRFFDISEQMEAEESVDVAPAEPVAEPAAE